MAMTSSTRMNVYDAGALTGAGISQRDVVDFIIQLIPEVTVKASAFGRTSAKNIRHEWFDDTLPTAAYTARIDGIDWPAASMTERVQNYNSTVILMTAYQVDGSQEAVAKKGSLAGVPSEESYQLSKAQKIHARSIEKVLTDGARTDGVIGTTARDCSGIRGASDGTGASAAPGITTNSTDLSGALTETNLNTAWNTCSTTYFGDPDLLLVNGGLKRVISRFGIYLDETASAAFGFSERQLEGKKRTVVVNVYECDYGTASIKLDRFIHNGELFALEKADYRLAWLRPTFIANPANLGDYEKKVITSEFSLEMRAEEHSFRLYGATNY